VRRHPLDLSAAAATGGGIHGCFLAAYERGGGGARVVGAA
jgi:hypothetical protein